MRSPTARLAAATAGTILVASALALDGVAATGSGEPPEPAALDLVSQTSWVPRDGVFQVVVDASGAPPDATVEVVIRDRVRGRIEFGRTVTGEQLRRPVHTVEVGTVGELRTAEGRLSVDIPIRTDGPPSAERASLRREGVYPTEVRLVSDGGDRLATLITHAIVVPAPDSDTTPLAAAYVADLVAPPSLDPTGSRREGGEEARLVGALAGVLADHADTPLTIAASPETLSGLADDGGEEARQVLEALRVSAPGRQVVELPYVPVDAAALVEADLLDELDLQLERGRSVLNEQLGVDPDPTVWLGRSALSPSAAAALHTRGRERFVLSEGQFSAVDAASPLSLTRRFDLAVPGGAVEGIRTDSIIGLRLAANADPELVGHTVLAELAVLALEEPSRSRGVVLRVADGAEPAVGTIDTVLAGLSVTNGLVDPVTLAQLFEQVEPLAEDAATIVPAPGPALDAYARALERTREVLASYQSFIGPISPRADRLERLALTSAARGLVLTDRRRYLATVRAEIAGEFSAVSISEARTVTLTARTGVIPITLRSEAAFPINVVVRLDSERLEFPDGPERLLTLTDEFTRVDITVRTRGSGSFPLRVDVRSPDSAVELAATRVTVRSTAVSGVGLVLSVGALVFLLVWWIRHAHHMRRDRRLVGAD